jgi:hypothetical protein
MSTYTHFTKLKHLIFLNGGSKKKGTHIENGVLNKGIEQDSPLKQDTGDELKTNVSTPNSSQRHTITKVLVGRPERN